MARVDYSGVPDVTAREAAPDDLQHVQTSPNAFGAQVAQGIGDVGQGIIKASDFYSDVAGTQAVNNAITQATNVMRGDPNKPATDANGQLVLGPDGKPMPDTGFLGLRGQSAMDARQAASQAIQKIIDQNGDTLSTPEAKLRYETQIRRYQAEWEGQMGAHADQQTQAWGVDVQNTSASLGMNKIASNPEDDATFAVGQDQIRHAYANISAMTYGDDRQANGPIYQGALLHADQVATKARIDALIVSNPQKAKQVFDDSHGLLGSLPDYDGLGQRVRTANLNATMGPAVSQAVTDGLADAQKNVGLAENGKAPMDFSAVPFASAKAKIYAGESRGNYNAQVGDRPDGTNIYGLKPQDFTSMTMGQVYDYQRNVMLPATKGKPLTGSNDPSFPGSSGIGAAQLVSGTLAAQAQAVFGDNWRDQPFTPANQDKLAENLYNTAHKDSAKLAAQWPSLAGHGMQYPSATDAMIANEPNVLAKAQATSSSIFPNDPSAQQEYVDNVRNRYRQEIALQNQVTVANTSVIQSVLDSDHPPLSEQDLTSRGPEVAAAWNKLQRTEPALAQHVRNSFNANATGMAGNLGSDFKTYLDRVLAPSDSPDRLANPGQLWQYIGPNEAAPLTNSGAKELASLMPIRGTPQGEASAAQLRSFVDTMHANLTFSNSAAGISDPKGEQKFAQYMAGVLPVLVNAQKNGKLAEVLNPASKDYVGAGAQTFMRSQSEIMKDRLDAQSSVGHLPPYTPQTFEHALGQLDNDQQRLDAIRTAVSQGRISKADADSVARSMGFIKQPNAPPPQTISQIDDVTRQTEAAGQSKLGQGQ